MTAKDYLKQAYRFNELIESNLHEVGRLRSLATKLSSFETTKMSVKNSKNGEASFTQIIEKIADFEQEVNSQAVRYIELIKEIRNTIDSVHDADERLLLRLRYIDYLTWDEIAEKMSFSIMQIHRIHSSALSHLKFSET